MLHRQLTKSVVIDKIYALKMKKGVETYMKNWLIIYTSVTGNTEKLAKAMANELGCDCFEVDNVPEDLEKYDVIVAGYWVRLGGPADKMKPFLSKLKNKTVVFFQTHGTYAGSEHAITSFARAGSLLGENCYVLGTLSVQGEINPNLLAKRSNMPNDKHHGATPENIARWEAAKGHPNEEDLQNAKKFIVEMQGRYERMLLRKQKLQQR